MVSLSTVQPSINLVFLSTDKNLKMPLYTLLKVSESTDFQIWKVMHEIIAEWWKTYVDPWSHYDNVLFTLNQTTLLSVFMNILIENWDTET